MADSFIGRWSQRKQAMRDGLPLAEPSPPAQPPSRSLSAAEAAAAPAIEPTAEPKAEASAEALAPPSPTLEDVQALTPQSDFQRFVASDVDPEVKHAAMRKLFSDPHYNLMDGLDIYIDDYNKPDPLPPSMLRQMASAQFLGVVCEELKPASQAALLSSPATPSSESVTAAASTPLEPARPEPEETQDHEHTDLRLQQDHAAGPQGSERSAG